MSKRTAKLTQGYVNSLPSDVKAYKVWDTDIKGFHVKVRPTGTKTYMYFYRVDGRDRWPAIGRHGSLTATEARAIAKEYAAKGTKGMDITNEKQAARRQAERDKSSLLGTFITEKYAPWAETHLKSHKETLRMVNVDWANLHAHPMTQITQWDVQKWAADAAKGKGYKKPLSPTTIKRRIKALQGVFSKAADWGVIDANPLAGLKQIKTDNTGRVRFLSPDEERRLRKAMDNRQARQRQERQRNNEWRQARQLDSYPELSGSFTDFLQPLVILAMNTGLRRGELFNLLWTDINLHGRNLTVQGSGAKSGQTRHIPLNDEAFNLLAAWRNQCSGTDLVFPSPRTGKRLDNIATSWENLCKAAALADFNFHDLRHHFASRLVMAGADLVTVKELLGHASIDMTMKYSHLAPQHKAAVVALLNQ